MRGEIDLSRGWAAGTAGSIAARVTNVQHACPWWAAFAVARAVNGGTSLDRARGKMTYPVVGGIILAVIINGRVVIQVSATMEFVLAGVVLLAAVTVDSLARRSQTRLKELSTSGRGRPGAPCRSGCEGWP